MIHTLDARWVKSKGEAKEVSLVDPGEVLAACNTIDACFNLFDADMSGEIDLQEMELMASLIGDFGEMLAGAYTRPLFVSTYAPLCGVGGAFSGCSGDVRGY